VTDLILPRRKFLAGAAAFLAAPAIVRVASLMPVKAERPALQPVTYFIEHNPSRAEVYLVIRELLNT